MDNEGNPISRRAVIREVYKNEKKLKLFRLSGPPKYSMDDEDSEDPVNSFAEDLGPNEELWDWTEMSLIEEIIVPPPTSIESDSIKCSKEKKNIEEIELTGPEPGFKQGMDLGADTEYFE